MNTKLYTKVHSLAKGLMKAADNNNQKFFDRQYEQLKQLCEDNEKGNKNHPVQWETLADFTEETDQALSVYRKALSYAEAISAHEYMASINYSMAILISDDGNKTLALDMAKNAQTYALKNADEQLISDINKLIASLDWANSDLWARLWNI